MSPPTHLLSTQLEVLITVSAAILSSSFILLGNIIASTVRLKMSSSLVSAVAEGDSQRIPASTSFSSLAGSSPGSDRPVRPTLDPANHSPSFVLLKS